ncbi:MAG: J domain-containing protein, partial [Deltaproteobacteria bacterium]|nr:J domain-containing protein [Deltaproteobacteria bacterium]
MSMDYYQILGVPRDAGAVEIKKAYRKLALKVHPDVNRDTPGAEEDFRKITEAYGVLIDPGKRMKYDSDSRGGFEREEVFRDIFSRSDFRDVFDDMPVKTEWMEKVLNLGKVIAYEALIYGGTPRQILKRSLLKLATHGAAKFFHNVMDIHEQITIPAEIASRGGHITIEYRPGFSMCRIKVSIP